MKALGIFLALIVAAMFVIEPAMANKSAAAQKKSWIKTETARLKQEFRAQKAELKQNYATAKAAVKRGDSYIKQQRQVTKQAAKNERRLRQVRERSRPSYIAAKEAFDKDPSDANKFALRRAEADYMPKRAAHEAALPILEAANKKLLQYQGQRLAAVDVATAAKQAKKKGPPPIAKPVYNANAALAGPNAPRQYDVVPALAPIVYGRLPPAPASQQAGPQAANPAGQFNLIVQQNGALLGQQ